MSSALRLARVLDALVRQTVTDVGAQLASQLAPAADAATAERRLDEVAEAEVVLRIEAAPPLPARLDPSDFLTRATRGATLEGPELALLGRLARTSQRARRTAQLWPPDIRHLRSIAINIPDLDLLGSLLADAVDDDGAILDSASPELARLRQDVLVLGARLRRRIESLVRETDAAGLLQDDYFTLRDDRYVLPVRATEKRTLGGIIHGASQTGSTVYVEPHELVEANNQLALASEAVRREERRILAELTVLCAEHAEPLADTAARLGQLDLRLASARLAIQLGAHRPRFCPDRIEAPALRHPILLLDGVQVIASQLSLSPPARWLVVSGPNGGGKTVAMTALGLMVEMARLGLFVCAGLDTHLPWFDRVEIVLGDAQDIERGLSTFEGHLRWVAHALKRAQQPGRTLILLDELAAGTEPLAGSALATAILEFATTQIPGTWGGVTTHFEALKLLALREPAFTNAALELDGRTLTPTYRVRMGQVGTSNPLALATRMGLAPAILDRAQQLMGSGGNEVATLLQRLEAERADYERRTQALEHERKQLEHSRTLLEDQRRNEQRATDRRVEKAAEQALAQLQAAAREVNQARASIISADRKRMEEATKALSARQVEVERTQRESKARLGGQVSREPVGERDLQPGESVWHAGLDRVVQILEVSAKADRFKIRAGSLEMWCPQSDLRRTIGRESAKPEAARKADRGQGVCAVSQPDTTTQPRDLDEGAALLRSPELTVDLRGMRVDEALQEVERHLDRMVLSGRPGACVVHGMGTGALRDSVRALLSRHPQVERHRSGVRGEGGDGATLVWLKD